MQNTSLYLGELSTAMRYNCLYLHIYSCTHTHTHTYHKRHCIVFIPARKDLLFTIPFVTWNTS